MVKNCCMCGKEQTKFNEQSFHKFPQLEELRNKWIDVVGKNISYKNARICSDHFHEDDFIDFHADRRILKKNVVPISIHETRIRSNNTILVIPDTSINLFENSNNGQQNINDEIIQAIESKNQYQRFPKNEEVALLWKRACGFFDNDNVSNVHICSKHFKFDDFIGGNSDKFQKLRRLKLGSIPSQNIPAKTETTNAATHEANSTEPCLENSYLIKQEVEEFEEHYNELEQPRCRVLNMEETAPFKQFLENCSIPIKVEVEDNQGQLDENSIPIKNEVEENQEQLDDENGIPIKLEVEENQEQHNENDISIKFEVEENQEQHKELIASRTYSALPEVTSTPISIKSEVEENQEQYNEIMSSSCLAFDDASHNKTLLDHKIKLEIQPNSDYELGMSSLSSASLEECIYEQSVENNRIPIKVEVQEIQNVLTLPCSSRDVESSSTDSTALSNVHITISKQKIRIKNLQQQHRRLLKKIGLLEKTIEKLRKERFI